MGSTLSATSGAVRWRCCLETIADPAADVLCRLRFCQPVAEVRSIHSQPAPRWARLAGLSACTLRGGGPCWLVPTRSNALQPMAANGPDEFVARGWSNRVTPEE